MRESVVKRNLKQDKTSIVLTLHIRDPAIYEMVSLMGPDAIWLDLEHHRHSVETAAELARAARVGRSDLLMRPANGEFTRMSRLLEIGAQGIMYPRCGSAEEARRVVEFAKFAPLGRRGFDGGGADSPYCDLGMAEYVRVANEQTFVIIQLEDRQSLEQAHEIAAVEGVDALMLGPGDFSVLEGIPGQVRSPAVVEATKRVADAATSQGKHWASIAFTPDHGRELAEQGARILMYGADLLMVKSGVQKMLEDFAWIDHSTEE